MPRELITVQVGQCGNQVALRFWDLALREHSKFNRTGIFDEPMSSFFRNVDMSYLNPRTIPVGSAISTLKARAVVVDMEEGVINSMLRSDIGELFDSRQFISDISGAGNNWAVGHYEYGPAHREQILESVRVAAEECDALQSFLLIHSMGGGTGSGVGTYILAMLADAYPEIFRFSTVVYPEDDVVTGPYNTLLAMNELTEHADCVLPVDNQALMEILQNIESTRTQNRGVKQDIAESADDQKKPFDKMNNIIAHMLSNLTCSMRFEGMLNVDLNEITMNLVPFPKMPYLISSISPLYSILDVKLEPRRLDQIFTDVTHRDFQLLKVDPRHYTYMACGLILRGDAKISDIHRNLSRIRPQLRMVHWNQEGFKIGLCNEPPVGMPYSLLCLANNSAICTQFNRIKQQYLRLSKRKAHMHHYTKYMSGSQFTDSLHSLEDLIERYAAFDGATESPVTSRIQPVI